MAAVPVALATPERSLQDWLAADVAWKGKRNLLKSSQMKT